MEMLTRLENAHKEFEKLVGNDYGNVLDSIIVPQVYMQVDFWLKNFGAEKMDPRAVFLPTVILVMNMFEKDLNLESKQWKKDNKELMAQKEMLKKSVTMEDAIKTEDKPSTPQQPEQSPHQQEQEKFKESTNLIISDE